MSSFFQREMSACARKCHQCNNISCCSTGWEQSRARSWCTVEGVPGERLGTPRTKQEEVPGGLKLPKEGVDCQAEPGSGLQPWKEAAAPVCIDTPSQFLLFLSILTLNSLPWKQKSFFFHQTCSCFCSSWHQKFTVSVWWVRWPHRVGWEHCGRKQLFYKKHCTQYIDEVTSCRQEAYLQYLLSFSIPASVSSKLLHRGFNFALDPDWFCPASHHMGCTHNPFVLVWGATLWARQSFPLLPLMQSSLGMLDC